MLAAMIRTSTWIGATASDRFEFLLLQDTQKFHLRVQRQLAHFVKEKRSPIRQLESSGAVTCRARKGAFDVPKKFAFHKASGNRSAVDLDQGSIFAPTAGVDGPGNKLLARTRLPAYQDVRIRGRDLLHQLQKFQQAGTIPNDFVRIVFPPDLFLEVLFLRGQAYPRLVHLPVIQGVVNGNGDLTRNLPEEINVFLAPGGALSAKPNGGFPSA